MDKIRVGVVGVGALGQHHARVYASLPDATLVGVADTRPGRAEEIAGPLGTQAFSDYRRLFGKVDAVSIATPTILHAEIGEQFLNEGVHVLVEKPISHTLADADRLIRAAQANNRVLQVGHLERFNPAIQAVREIVNRPRFFEAHRMGLFTPRSLDIDVILDLMIHDLDIISLLVAAPPVHIEAVGIAILTKRIDIANARIQFAGRLRGQRDRQPGFHGEDPQAALFPGSGVYLAGLHEAGCGDLSPRWDAYRRSPDCQPETHAAAAGTAHGGTDCLPRRCPGTHPGGLHRGRGEEDPRCGSPDSGAGGESAGASS